MTIPGNVVNVHIGEVIYYIKIIWCRSICSRFNSFGMKIAGPSGLIINADYVGLNTDILITL